METCGVCFDCKYPIFNPNMYDDKACDHGYCFNCWKAMFRNKENASCPSCRGDVDKLRIELMENGNSICENPRCDNPYKTFKTTSMTDLGYVGCDHQVCNMCWLGLLHFVGKSDWKCPVCHCEAREFIIQFASMTIENRLD